MTERESFNPENQIREQLLNENIIKHLELKYKPELAEIWAENNLANDDIEKYVEKIKNYGSGHLAIHVSKREFLDLALRRGYLPPRKVAQRFAEQEGSDEWEEFRDAQYLVASEALHFSIDEAYTRNQDIAFVASVEALIENKSFMSIPLDYVGKGDYKNDMTVSGRAEDPLDESNKFKIDSLGILFIPKNLRVFRDSGRALGRYETWIEDETPTISIEEYISQLEAKRHNVPKKIYLYDGYSIEDGIRQFMEEYNLSFPSKEKKITTSAPVKYAYKRGTGSLSHFHPEGQGMYFQVERKEKI